MSFVEWTDTKASSVDSLILVLISCRKRLADFFIQEKKSTWTFTNPPKGSTNFASKTITSICPGWSFRPAPTKPPILFGLLALQGEIRRPWFELFKGSLPVNYVRKLMITVCLYKYNQKKRMRPLEKLIQEQDANQWLQPNFPEPFA